MIRAALSASLLLALGACATPLPHIVEREGDLFDVRYDAGVQSQAEADARANAYCANGAAGFVSEETRFDGFAYRTYRCAAAETRASTVSVALSGESDAIARQQCGGDARPETVSHEINVIIYRCLRDAP